MRDSSSDSSSSLWESKVWEPNTPELYVDRLRLVTTRMMIAARKGLWGGYFSKLDALSGLSFLHLDCHKMFQTVDFCDMFLDLSSKVN